jgi:hypothetical protein
MAMELHSTKHLDRVKEAIRYKHYSASTEQVYVYWCRCYIRFHQLSHPKDMGAVEVAAIFSYLANEKHVGTIECNEIVRISFPHRRLS